MTRFLVHDFAEYTLALQLARVEGQLVHRLCAEHGPAIGDFITLVYGFAEGPLPPALAAAIKVPPDDEGFCIVLGLAAGGPLAGVIHHGPPVRPMTMLDKLRALAQVARAVAELHAVGLVHGDLKPDNILLGDSGFESIKIADFGMSKIREGLESTLGQSSLQRTGGIKGTPVYCAPEMFEEEDEEDDDDGQERVYTDGVARASRSTDMYAFGLIAYEVLARKKPFGEIKTINKLSKKVCSGARPPLNKLPADTPPAVTTMIQQCWDGDRAQRLSAYRCVEVLAIALAPFEQASEVAERSVSPRSVEPLSRTLLRRVEALALIMERVEMQQAAGFVAVHTHLDELSAQLSQSLERLGGALSDLSQRAAAGDARMEAGLVALSTALDDHRAALAQHGATATPPEQLAELIRTATATLDRDLSAQLQQCIAAVMTHSHEAAGRHASDRDKLDAIASVMGDLRTEVGGVRLLAEEQRDLLSIIEERGNIMPHTFIILPEAHPPLDAKAGADASTGSKIKNFLLRRKDQALGLLWERSRLFFVCPVTRQVVPCGPEGQGYLISLPTALLRALAPALRWGVLFLKVALATQGLGGLVPDLPAEMLRWTGEGAGVLPLSATQAVVDQLSTDLALWPNGLVAGAILSTRPDTRPDTRPRACTRPGSPRGLRGSRGPRGPGTCLAARAAGGGKHATTHRRPSPHANHH